MGRTDGVGGFTGAGSSADAPLVAKAVQGYCGSLSCIIYSPFGSGEGEENLNAGNVDFGCFDVPMLKRDAFSNFKKIVQFPVALFGVSLIYNLKDYHFKLKLTGTQIALIYEGKITKWNDKRLTNTNPALKRDNTSIIPVVREDSSGTSYAFTDYLSHVNKGFVKHYGKGKVPSMTPPWPKSFGEGSHSSGVAAAVGKTDGAIGYVETTYYEFNKDSLGEAYVESKNNTWLQPTLNTIASDAAHIGKISPSHFAIVNSVGRNSYPISSFSWCGMYRKFQNNRGTTFSRTKHALKFFEWEISTGGQQYGPALDYPKLPASIRSVALSQLKKIEP